MRGATFQGKEKHRRIPRLMRGGLALVCLIAPAIASAQEPTIALSPSVPLPAKAPVVPAGVQTPFAPNPGNSPANPTVSAVRRITLDEAQQAAAAAQNPLARLGQLQVDAAGQNRKGFQSQYFPSIRGIFFSKSKSEKSCEAASADVAATPSETRQANVVETAEISGPSDSSKPLAPPGGTGASPSAGPGQQSPSDGWQVQFSPYLFLAGLKGTLGVRGLTADVDAPFRDLIKNLNFGFMGILEARKNKFLVLTDVMYMSLATSRGTPGPLFSSVHADVKAFILGPEVGYRVAETERASLYVVAGIRYWHLRTDLDFRPGILPATQRSGSKNWVDAVGGLKGKVHLSPRFFLTGLGDFGGGGSDFTYQLFGGGGFQTSKKVALVIGYRYLKTDYDRDNFLFNISMKGVMVGVTFKF